MAKTFIASKSWLRRLARPLWATSGSGLKTPMENTKRSTYRAQRKAAHNKCIHVNIAKRIVLDKTDFFVNPLRVYYPKMLN